MRKNSQKKLKIAPKIQIFWKNQNACTFCVDFFQNWMSFCFPFVCFNLHMSCPQAFASLFIQHSSQWFHSRLAAGFFNQKIIFFIQKFGFFCKRIMPAGSRIFFWKKCPLWFHSNMCYALNASQKVELWCSRSTLPCPGFVIPASDKMFFTHFENFIQSNPKRNVNWLLLILFEIVWDSIQLYSI